MSPEKRILDTQGIAFCFSYYLEFGARGAGRAEILSGLTQGLPMWPGRTFVAMAEEERFELS